MFLFRGYHHKFLICICQRDLKSLIAYSYVAHIGIVLRGIITIDCWGIIGALLIILARGFMFFRIVLFSEY